MVKVIAALKKFGSVESGATMIEYALMLGLIAVACFIAVKLIGQATVLLFNLPGF